MLLGLVAILIVLGATFHFALDLHSQPAVPKGPAAEHVALASAAHN